MEIIINRVAIWQPKLSGDALSTNITPIGSKYQTKESEVLQISDKPIYRYAKNYEADKEKYCLFVRSFLDDNEVVEAELDEVAKKITAEDARKAKNLASVDPMAFNYTDYYILEDKEN